MNTPDLLKHMQASIEGLLTVAKEQADKVDELATGNLLMMQQVLIGLDGAGFNASVAVRDHLRALRRGMNDDQRKNIRHLPMLLLLDMLDPPAPPAPVVPLQPKR